MKHINTYPAKVIYLNFHPLEVVSRYRDPQLQVDENYYLFNLKSICKSWCLNIHFDQEIKQIKNDDSRGQQDKGWPLQCGNRL